MSPLQKEERRAEEFKSWDPFARAEGPPKEWKIQARNASHFLIPNSTVA